MVKAKALAGLPNLGTPLRMSGVETLMHCLLSLTAGYTVAPQPSPCLHLSFRILRYPRRYELRVLRFKSAIARY